MTEVTKDVKFGTEQQDALLKGQKTLAKAVKTTLGPKGKNVIIQNAFGKPTMTKDGVTVQRTLELKEPSENLGQEILKEVQLKIQEETGDGTTTGTVLQEAMMSEGLKALKTGQNGIDIKRGIDLGIKEVTEYLKSISKPCEDEQSWKEVQTISSNSDTLIGEIISAQMSEVTPQGVITVETSNSLEDELRVHEGMELDSGFMSSFFLGENQSSIAFENPYILVLNKKIHHLQEMINVLEEVSKTTRPLVIVAEDVDSEALSTLILNNARGQIKCCVVKAPSVGQNQANILGDLSVLVGASVISEQSDVLLERQGLEELGEARKVLIDKSTCTIVGGFGLPQSIQERVQSLKELNPQNTFEQKQIQSRIGKLSGGVQVIRVGGLTEVQIQEKKVRVQDALQATKAQTQEGIVPGGGQALIRCLSALEGLEGENADQNLGVLTVKKALEAPLRQIQLNQGLDASVIVQKVKELESEGLSFGYNAGTGEYGDLLEMGVIDPTKVTRTALQSAGSIASMLLMTDVLITQ